MQLITSHLNTDFDSVASMVAIQKLYPDAVICPPGAMNRRVRDFMSRYVHLWSFQKPSKIPIDEVTLMVVVDTRSRQRIGPFVSLAGKQDVEVHVYDHHPPTIDDISAGKMVYEHIGATTTMIVERISKERIRVSPEEATLFSMGIYDDTGALTYDATTDRDIIAVARLRQMGADMSMIISRVEATMPSKDRKMLDDLAENAEESYINGAKVVLTWADSDEYIEGLAIFVHKLRDTCDSHVTIAAVRCGKKTCIIGRSSPDVLNVKNFLAPYGGSGHEQAGSATLPERDPRELLKEFKVRLGEMIKPMLKVESVMASPVLAVSPDSAVQEAYRTMLRFGHKALPVVKDGEVVGMMTRNDLDKAHLHGYDRAKIRDFMTEGVIAIASEASVNEAHRLMATYNFERLPVLHKGRLVGIVTRADLVRSLYQFQTYRALGDKEVDRAELTVEDVSELLDGTLPPEQKNLMKRIGKRADELGMKAYIVGGAVRDILKGESNIDMDIALEGDAEIFVQNWNEPGCRCTLHGRYKTGTIIFPDGNKVDIATARREFYEYAAAMPEVSSDSLKQDLARRDFSINAIAISVGEKNWGTLLDFYGGRRDLKEGLLRVLHNLSLVEDPSRILRGVRLEQRLGLKFEDNTMRLIHSAIKGGLLEKLSGPRIRLELETDFKERLPLKIVERSLELGIWESLFPGLRIGNSALRKLGRLQKILPRAKRAGINFKGKEWLTYMAALFSDSSGTVQSGAMDRLYFAPHEREIIAACLTAPAAVEQFLGSSGALKNSEVYLFLKGYDPIQLLYCMAAVKRRQTKRWITLHAFSFVPTKRELTGDDMLNMGYKAGRWIGEILEAIKLERMDGNIKTREEEMQYLDESLMRR
jgi:tRNA nucleotidyltransferase (CCA-adding enzyme)